MSIGKFDVNLPLNMTTNGPMHNWEQSIHNFTNLILFNVQELGNGKHVAHLFKTQILRIRLVPMKKLIFAL